LKSWWQLSADIAMSGVEAQRVMTLRFLKLAAGGPKAASEAGQNGGRKGGGLGRSGRHACVRAVRPKGVRRYRSVIRANEKRLTKKTRRALPVLVASVRLRLRSRFCFGACEIAEYRCDGEGTSFALVVRQAVLGLDVTLDHDVDPFLDVTDIVDRRIICWLQKQPRWSNWQCLGADNDVGTLSRLRPCLSSCSWWRIPGFRTSTVKHW